MSALLKLNNFIAAFIDALRSMFYIRIWAPFFIFMLISLAVAFMLLNPFSGFWSGLAIAIGKTKLFSGGPGFVHYPQHMIMVPGVYGKVSIIVSILFDSILTATGFIMFARFFAGEQVRFFESLKDAFRKYLWLVLASILVYAVLYLVSRYLPEVFRDFLVGSPRRQIAFDFAFKVFMFFVLSPFVYIQPYLVIDDENLLVAVGKSIKMWFRNFFSTFFAIFLTQLLLLPFAVGMDFSFRLASSYSPELINWLLYGHVVLFMFASFVLTAMLTRFFVEYHE
ncbi:MAG: hypothetical protein GF404_06160 [candidate division Zixibacteria bacterium]|nr:hypothetical protein [candidate division Zixibacteria bacterium]